jgi:hypothetical protein
MGGDGEVNAISNGGTWKRRRGRAIRRSSRAGHLPPAGLSVGVGTGLERRRGSPIACRRLSRAGRVGQLPSPLSVSRGGRRMMSRQDGSEGEENSSPFFPSGHCLSARLGIVNVASQLFLRVLPPRYETAGTYGIVESANSGHRQKWSHQSTREQQAVPRAHGRIF